MKTGGGISRILSVSVRRKEEFMLIVLKTAIAVFLIMELSNILILYFKPDFRYGNSMNVFKRWHEAQEREDERLFVKYMVNWVANCKLIFLALLMVVLVCGNEIITVCAVAATILSIAIYFVTLHPVIERLDEMGEIQPKGYSRTLAFTIGAFMLMFSLALVLYFMMK